jgi:hydrogenase maturation protease
MDRKILLIGYGNVYCRDDGVALYVINQLRCLQGISELDTDEDGLDDLGHVFDSIMLHQLVPEIIITIAHYDMVVFIDAHLGTIPEDVRVIQVQEEHRFHAVTHHMSPGMILYMTRESKGRVPEAYLVSVRGESFDFGVGLSDRCRVSADLAVTRILDLAQSNPCDLQ